jgi:hypothetical protein
MILGFITTLFGMPYMILLAGFVTEDLGQTRAAFGFLQSVTGVGALVGSLLIATLTEFTRKPLLQFGTGVLAGVGLLLLGVLPIAFGFPGALAAIIVLGFAFSVFQTLNNTMIMTVAHPEYQGRVMSIYMLTFSGFSLMALPLGWGADAIGASNIFMILGGMIGVLFVFSAVINPRYTFGRHDDRPSWADDPAFAHGGPMRMPGMGGPRGPIPAVALVGGGNGNGQVAAAAVAEVARPRRGARRDYLTGSPRPARSYMGGVLPVVPQANDAVAGEAPNGAAEGARRSGSRDYGIGAPAGSEFGAYGLIEGTNGLGATGAAASGRRANGYAATGPARGASEAPFGGSEAGAGGYGFGAPARPATSAYRANGDGRRAYESNGDRGSTDASARSGPSYGLDGDQTASGAHAYGLESPPEHDPEEPLLIEAPAPPPEPEAPALEEPEREPDVRAHEPDVPRPEPARAREAMTPGGEAAWRPMPPPPSNGTNGSEPEHAATPAQEPPPVERVSVPPADAAPAPGVGSIAVVAGITATAVSAAAAMLLGRADRI